MDEKKKEEKLGEALLKVALGYQVAEVTEEYAEVDGALKLLRRKKTKKDVPPDLKAVQMLLEGEKTGSFAEWSDEDLERELERLRACLGKAETAEKIPKRTVRKSVRKSVKKSGTRSVKKKE